MFLNILNVNEILRIADIEVRSLVVNRPEKFPTVFSGSAASQQLSSETPWVFCWCSIWPTGKASSTSGIGWVRVTSAARSAFSHQPWWSSDANLPFKSSQWCFQFVHACLALSRVWRFSSCFSGQLQANAYCDSPDIVLVGTKADLRGMRDVHARQARDLADRYGWGL